MSAKPANFRQQDVTRAINAAKRAGLTVTRVEVDPKTAKISIICGEAEKAETNPWNTATMAPIGGHKPINPFPSAPVPHTKPRRRRDQSESDFQAAKQKYEQWECDVKHWHKSRTDGETKA
jgi:hypothetical protein